MDDNARTRTGPDSAAAAPVRPSSSPTDPRRAEFEANKLRKRLRRQVGEAIGAYELIAPSDRVMVCVSGGKVIGTTQDM